MASQLKNYLSKVVDKSIQNALNQELSNILQKIQPASIYLWRVLASSGAGNNYEKETEETPKVRKWKQRLTGVNRKSLMTRTVDIITQINNANTNESVFNRVEDLNNHLKKYPDAKHMAVKSDAIILLLRLKLKTTNESVLGALNEALALLGHTNPVSGRGIRILSLDGGGVRGILVIEMLKKLETLTGKRIIDMFDLICGVSTGAIIASLLGIRNFTLNEAYEVYKNLSRQIFTQSSLRGTSNLVWNHGYYDTALWEKLLQENIGNERLIYSARNPRCPKLCFVSSVLNQSTLSAYIFRNYAMPCHVQSKYRGSHTHRIWEAIRASAAAPTYFEEFKLGNMLHQDGGMLFNNPTAVAIHEAKLLWPETPLQCVLSFGTGRTVPVPVDANSITTLSSSLWTTEFYAVVNKATDTEGVHTLLTDLLPERVYYRFNPYLTEMIDMAEIDSTKLEQLRRDAVMYLRRNEDKFHEVAKVLSYEKTLRQRVIEWLNLQMELQGLRFLR